MTVRDTLPMTESGALTAALRWLVEIGADEAVCDTPQDRTVASAPSPSFPDSRSEPSPDRTGTPARASRARGADSVPTASVPGLPIAGRSESALRAAAAATGAGDLKVLSRAIASFDGIALRETATKMVFSDGLPGADVMLVGEAPGADEDRQGKPFVGVSGQLLDKILAAVGLSRASEDPQASIYISNILNWRPPGNRTPSDAEVETSLPFIERHIVLARPKLLILCGSVSASALLGRREAIGRLRGRWHAWRPVTPGVAPEGFAPVPAIATYHPSFLLRSPEQKRAAWADMRLLQRKRMEMGLLSAAGVSEEPAS